MLINCKKQFKTFMLLIIIFHVLTNSSVAKQPENSNIDDVNLIKISKLNRENNSQIKTLHSELLKNINKDDKNKPVTQEPTKKDLNILDNISPNQLKQTNKKQPDSLNNVNLNSSKQEPNLVTLTGALFFVIFLILIFGWLYAKLQRINLNKVFEGKFETTDADSLKILSTVSLGQGKTVHLMEVNGKKFVIGSTANNINLIADLSTSNKSFENIMSTRDVDILNINESDDYDSVYSDDYKEYLKKNKKEK